MGQRNLPLGVRRGAYDWEIFIKLKLAQSDLVQGKSAYYDWKLKEGNSTLVTFLKHVLLNGVIWMEKKYACNPAGYAKDNGHIRLMRKKGMFLSSVVTPKPTVFPSISSCWVKPHK